MKHGPEGLDFGVVPRGMNAIGQERHHQVRLGINPERGPGKSEMPDRFGRKSSQIEHIYISSGPGSFTGLRIATTLAKTMHLANAVKIVTVDTLDVIAANVIDFAGGKSFSPLSHGKIAAVLDAKRGQFFIAVYKRNPGGERRAKSDGIWKKVLPDTLMSASQFLADCARRKEPIWLLGDGLLYYEDKFMAEGVCFLDRKYWSPRAAKVHLLGWQMAQQGQFAEAVTLAPFYLRCPDVTVKPR